MDNFFSWVETSWTDSSKNILFDELWKWAKMKGLVPNFLRLFCSFEIKMFCVVVYLLICYVSRLLISICWHLSRVTQSVTKKPFSVFLASADWLLLIVIVLIFLDPVNLEWRWVTKVVVTVAALGQLVQINANSPSDYRVQQQLLIHKKGLEMRKS